MEEQYRTLTRHDLEAKIVKRCWEDEAFRQEFTADPVAAFVEYLEVSPVSLPKIVVLEEPAGSWHIVLPSRPANADELSERDLEKVAGGVPSLVVIPPLLGVSQVISAVVGSAAASAGVTASAVVVSIKASGW
jgi:hypothetical protein